jgi:hypothetical protein
VPTWFCVASRAAAPRLAEGRRRRRARGGLDGGEHGARLARVRVRPIMPPAAKILLPHHYRPAMRSIFLTSAQAGTFRCLVLEQFDQPGILLSRLLDSTDIAPLTSSRRR